MSNSDKSPDDHSTVSAWFFGPRGENLGLLNTLIDGVTSNVAQGRQEFWPNDPMFIDASVQDSLAFQLSRDKFERKIGLLSNYMRQHCVPFYSPRYMGHMSTESTLPAITGYVLGLMYNQNNVATEASPLTSVLEWEVGQQLCKMLGFRRQPPKPLPQPRTLDEEPYGWGHITCGGSIANLEALWCARNLKFYPLCLKSAMTLSKPSDSSSPPPFAFAYDTFTIPVLNASSHTHDTTPAHTASSTTSGSQELEHEKLFKDCSTWELLNLRASTVLSLPARLTAQFGVSPTFVQDAMTEYDVQTVGKQSVEVKYGVKEPRGFVARTKHYSWPKGAALTGIGSANLLALPVDLDARLSVPALRGALRECHDAQRPVYVVVAIIGSTEHGAVDPLQDILDLRQEYEASYGMSFLVHVDGAWGGYFAAIKQSPKLGRQMPDAPPYVGKIPLSPYTNKQILAMSRADSITIDPHKSGYVPYPAGGLCYRDERMRFLVTWTSPYLDGQQGGVESMGVYGVEGSKPGAAAVATFLAHDVMGLNWNRKLEDDGPTGYQILLGEAVWTASRMYCHWVVMDTGTDGIQVIPFQRLPAERDGGDVEAQKEEIRKTLLDQPNLDITDEAYKLLSSLGSDLMINTFACNFRIGDQLNRSVAEANYLNKRILNTLSVMQVSDNIQNKPLIIMATSLAQNEYGDCLTRFKERMGLDPDNGEDLYTLCNVYMSPFATVHNFISELASAFKDVAQDISKASSSLDRRENNPVHVLTMIMFTQDCRWRNSVSPDKHTFLLQGTNPVHLVYLPNFQAENAREHVIISTSLPADVLAEYMESTSPESSEFFTLSTTEKVLLESILSQGASFTATLSRGYPDGNTRLSELSTPHSAVTFQVSVNQIILRYSLNDRNLDNEYPQFMPFYLYGTPQEVHLEHLLVRFPNVQISSAKVMLDFGEKQKLVEDGLTGGCIVLMDDVREYTMMPCTASNPPLRFQDANLAKPFPATVYRLKGTFSARGWKDHVGEEVARGSVTLSVPVVVDYNLLNLDLTDPDSPIAKLPRSIYNRFALDKQSAGLWDDYQRRMAVRREWRDTLFESIKYEVGTEE
ncbi:pyridoxal-dependent decarboxylase domain protein [Amylocystis lapponica]|nr:pyridoxal-dependent decarboxylase domain protein [Amylocystis lapponica]